MGPGLRPAPPPGGTGSGTGGKGVAAAGRGEPAGRKPGDDAAGPRYIPTGRRICYRIVMKEVEGWNRPDWPE